MNILITGGSGFVGRNLIEYLEKKHQLFHPSHKELELLDEQAVANYIKGNQIEVVIHCANVGATRRTDNLPHIVSNNLRMFFNLAKQSDQYRRMLFFGSGAEYDKRHPIVKVNENYISPTLPGSDYGFSKYICSHFIGHNPKIVNLRMFGVYGKYDDYQNRFVSNAVCRAVLGLPVVIYQDQLMDFIFADDLVKITGHFVENNFEHQFYNIGTGQARRLIEIAEMVKKVSGKDLEIKIQNPGMANEYTCNVSRLHKQLGNFEFTNFDQSLKDLYSWYDQHRDLISRTKLPE